MFCRKFYKAKWRKSFFYLVEEGGRSRDKRMVLCICMFICVSTSTVPKRPKWQSWGRSVCCGGHGRTAACALVSVISSINSSSQIVSLSLTSSAGCGIVHVICCVAAFFNQQINSPAYWLILLLFDYWLRKFMGYPVRRGVLALTVFLCVQHFRNVQPVLQCTAVKRTFRLYHVTVTLAPRLPTFTL